MVGRKEYFRQCNAAVTWEWMKNRHAIASDITGIATHHSEWNVVHSDPCTIAAASAVMTCQYMHKGGFALRV